MLARFENGYYLEVIINKEELNYDYHIYDEDRWSKDCGWTGYRSMELYHPMNEIDYICEFCDPDFVEGKYEILPYETMEDYEEYLDYLEDGDDDGDWCLECQGTDYDDMFLYLNKEDAQAAMIHKATELLEEKQWCDLYQGDDFCEVSGEEYFQRWTVYECDHAYTNKDCILNAMQMNLNRAYIGVDHYACELQDTCVATQYLDELQILLDRLKEMI